MDCGYSLKALGLVVMATCVLVVLMPGLAAAPQGEPEVPPCSRHGQGTMAGLGCCEQQPPICDYIMYSYDAYCAGECPVSQWCWGFAWEYVLVFKFIECEGSCPAPCDRQPAQETWGWLPSECACAFWCR